MLAFGFLWSFGRLRRIVVETRLHGYFALAARCRVYCSGRMHTISPCGLTRLTCFPLPTLSSPPLRIFDVALREVCPSCYTVFHRFSFVNIVFQSAFRLSVYFLMMGRHRYCHIKSFENPLPSKKEKKICIILNWAWPLLTQLKYIVTKICGR